jgi:hypothetical protein
MFLLDELLYYARDENQFLRRRRTFVFALHPDLVEARHKDRDLPYQRIVMLLALLYVLVKKLEEWLDTDALIFRFVFLGEGEDEPLAHERDLIRSLLFEEVALETVQVERLPAKNLGRRCEEWARKSMVHCLMLGVKPDPLEADETVVTRLAINAARPSLGDGDEPMHPLEGDDDSDAWAKALQQVLMRWI